MTLAGALILLAVGLLLVFLTAGVLHVIGIVAAAVAVVALLFILLAPHHGAGPRI